MSDINDQPPPVANDRAAVWDLVIADMRDRDAVGRERYGTPLQPHNGRAALVDAYQEALDLVVYLRQRIAEDADHCAEIARLTAELAAARAVPADVEAAIGELEHRAFETGHGYGVADMAKMSRHADLRVTARDHLRAAIARAISDATSAPSTVGGLLAAGEERESRAWSEKGKAPPGSCPFCASRISMVQRDGYFIARCSHRGCGAVGPRMRSVSRAADLFCQPPRREAQGMSCGPIVASPPRPRCSCTHEAGDSICDAHPSCSECGDSTSRNVDDCADHCQVCASLRRGDAITDWTATCQACKSRGPLPKGG